MQETSTYAVGLDIGTTKVRAVVAHVDGSTGVPTIVGIGQAATTGMRKGVVVNLQGPGHAIDTALGEAERMSGYEVHGATLSVNGAHLLTTHADGMVAAPNVDLAGEIPDQLTAKISYEAAAKSMKVVNDMQQQTIDMVS